MALVLVSLASWQVDDPSLSYASGNPAKNWLGFPGYEAVMRIGTGMAELIASLLILYPRTQGLGALMSTGIMTGAIFFHVVSPLGIDPYDDGADLFKKACAVWVLGLFIAYLRRADLIALWNFVRTQRLAAAR